MSLLIFENFRSNLTRIPHGDPASGYARFDTTYNVGNFQVPTCIFFNDIPTDITGNVITDALMDGKIRIELGVMYVYAIGHTGNLYKIQVTNPTYQAPAYDVATLVKTLDTIPSMVYGGTLDFFGDNEMIYIGHDAGVTRINFDGSNEELITNDSSWVQNVPRQGKIFNNSFYFTNGSDIAVIDKTGVIVRNGVNPIPSIEYTAKDIDIDVMGKNLIIVCSNIPSVSILTQPNLNATYGGTSVIVTWDGISDKVDSQNYVISFDQTATTTTGTQSYVFGYDIAGSVISKLDSEGLTKIRGMLYSQSTVPNASSTNANLVGWAVPEFKNGALVYSNFLYGPLDEDFGTSFNRTIQFPSSLPGGDVLRIPLFLLLTNLGFGGATSGYSGDVIGIGRSYSSTVEYDGNNYAYKLYSIPNVSSGIAAGAGVYETQTVLSTTGLYTPTKVTVYLQPTQGGESFTASLVGIDGNVLSGSTVSFTPAAGNILLTSGTLSVSSSAAVGVRITNSGLVTPIIHKIEVEVGQNVNIYMASRDTTAVTTSATLNIV